MKYTYWQQQMNGDYAEVGHFTHDSPGSTDFDGLIRHHFVTDPVAGDRVTVERGMGGEVWERNEFGTWDSIASGPAGGGIIGAMEEQ